MAGRRGMGEEQGSAGGGGRRREGKEGKQICENARVLAHRHYLAQRNPKVGYMFRSCFKNISVISFRPIISTFT